MPTMIISKRGLKLSVKEGELFCSADLSKNPESLAEQRYIAVKLAQIYETGRDELNKNGWKAKKYLAQATDSIPVKHGFWSAETGFNLLGLFTAIRSNITRVNRALNLPFIGKAFLNRLFAIAGFSFFLELFLDLYLTTKHAYSAMPFETDEEKNLPFFIRMKERSLTFFRCFHNALYEDGRIYRMLNAIVWGGLNLFLFLVATPLAIANNVIGFAFDVASRFNQTSADVGTHKWLHAKIYSKVMALEDQELELNRALILLRFKQKKLINDLNTNKEGKACDYKQEHTMESEITALAEQIQNKKHTLLHIKNDLYRRRFEEHTFKQKLDGAQKKRFTAMTLVTIILVGVILYSIPGLNIGLVALGTAIVLVAGIYSLSTKLWEYGKKIHCFFKNAYHKYKLEKAETMKDNKHISSVQSLSSSHIKTQENKYTSSSLLPLDSAVDSANDTHANSRGLNTTAIKLLTREKIEFIKRCQRKTTASNSFAESFEIFSKNEIQDLKSIFNFKKDEQWNKQLKYWIKYSNNPQVNPTNYKSGLFYQCSFKESLRERIHEEREFGLMLDSNESRLTERLREAEHRFQLNSKEEELTPDLESNPRLALVF